LRVDVLEHERQQFAAVLGEIQRPQSPVRGIRIARELSRRHLACRRAQDRSVGRRQLHGCPGLRLSRRADCRECCRSLADQSRRTGR
jgi:hypothetical protein